jgi:hypothetical protein
MVLLVVAVAHAASSALSISSGAQHQGFVGVYHTAHGVVHGAGSTGDGGAYDAGDWGIVGQSNSPSDGGLSFVDGIRFHCRTKDINALYGLLTPPSEGGVFSNTNDTGAVPVPHRPTGPLGRPGLLQGAARWSELARTSCPQIAGVVIDDFWSNYPSSTNPPNHPHPPSETRCPACCQAAAACRESVCPADRPHLYGHVATGLYCCRWPAPVHGHCAPPDGVVQPSHPPCCLCPGTELGCQGEAQCHSPRTNRSQVSRWRRVCASGCLLG